MIDAHRIPSLLHDILHHARQARGYYGRFESASGFLADPIARDAVLWNLLVIGEVCVRLGPSFHALHPEIPWRQMIGQRNIIAHGYDVLDWNKLQPVLERDIHRLIEQMDRILAAYGPPPEPPIARSTSP